MIRHAISEATKSGFRYRLGAVITRKGRIVGRGHNRIRHHGFSMYPYSHSLHAEADAARRMLRCGSSGDTIYVARVNQSGSVGMARPCKHCVSLLRSLNIEWVVYTTPEGSVRQKISQLSYSDSPLEDSCCSSDEDFLSKEM